LRAAAHQLSHWWYEPRGDTGAPEQETTCGHPSLLAPHWAGNFDEDAGGWQHLASG